MAYWILFTANLAPPNQLYLNKVSISKFENVTDKAGVGRTRALSTGVAMQMSTAIGHFLDIYGLQLQGISSGETSKNELFINNGDGTLPSRRKPLA